ncbi:MAG: hypothetical protein KAX13_11935, partial [Candidatus Krumholzibacteria bacterium]|nr:hypothetical protein [Candidatus Krumholzibacteria bacterium]
NPELHLGFPNMNKSNPFFHRYIDPYYYTSIAPGTSNEITMYGIGLGEWRFAASAEWRIDYTERSKPSYSSYHGHFPEIQQGTRYETAKNNKRYVRVDLSAARELAGDYKLGIRLGGTTAKIEDSVTNVTTTHFFDIHTDPYELVPEGRRYSHSVENEVVCYSGGFVQIGLLRDSESKLRSIDLRISRNETYLRHLHQNIYSDTHYDQWGDPDEYDREETKWRDERSGTIWSYDLFGRLSSASGLRIFAGVGFEHMNYETDWMDLVYDYGWSDYNYPEMDNRATMDFEGDGDYAGASAFLKIGKTMRLRDDLEITAGLHAWMTRRWTDEKPLADITIYSLVDESFFTISLDKPLEISTDRTDAGLNIPIAIDFEPANWVSIWSGFRVYTRYRRLNDEIPKIDALHLENFTSALELENYTSAYDTYQLDDVYVGSTATVGVSLHYKDRFFVDIYTGSDVTPDYLTNYILDIRYVF